MPESRLLFGGCARDFCFLLRRFVAVLVCWITILGVPAGHTT